MNTKTILSLILLVCTLALGVKAYAALGHAIERATAAHATAEV